MAEPVVRVFLETELVRAYTELPAFEELMRDLSASLGKSADEFQVTLNGRAIANSEELADAEKPIQLSVELISGLCIFCSSTLLLGTSQCERCQTENWEQWALQRFGEDAMVRVLETQPKLLPAFSFGPNVQVHASSPPKQQVFESAKEPSECSKGDLEVRDLEEASSSGDQAYELKAVLGRESFGNAEAKAEEPASRTTEKQSESTRRAHNRHHCKICQGETLPLGGNRGLLTQQFRRSDLASTIGTRSWRLSDARNSYRLPEAAETKKKCRTCWCEFPWYQDVCFLCEARRSLCRHPDSKYKQRVLQWC